MKFTKEITTAFKQVASLIKKSQNIVLMPHAKMDCDGMSASVALHLILNKFGKHSTTVCSDPVPEAFVFLPSSDIFSQEIIKEDKKNQKFKISVNNKNNKFKNLEYSVENGKVNILLFSEDSPFEESDFTFLGAQLKPDLIITLDSGDTFQLGKMYNDNIKLFEEVPVINIDHHFSNTQFGDVNLVESTSCSTTELIYNLIPYLEKEFKVNDEENNNIKNKEILDANISTLLLAGMLTDTGSFQHSNTTPEALDIASILIDHGAEHQKIVKQLFKTKSLSTLKIWGRVLTKLQNDPIYKIVWSSVSRNDLEETGSHSDDTNDLIDELMATTPDTELVLLVKEREDDIISTSVRSSSDDVDSVEFTSIFGGGGHKQAAGFKIRERGGKSFEEIVSDIVFEAKLFQAKRLHAPIPKRGLEDLIAKQSESQIITEKTEEISETSNENKMPDLPEYLHDIQHEEETIQENKDKIDKTEEIVEIVEIVENKNAESVENTENIELDEKNKIEQEKKSEVKIENIEKIEKIENIKKDDIEDIEEIVDNKDSENTDLFGEPIIENTEKLSEEEIPYAEHKEYFDMPKPEKYIEKEEEETNYDDFADFLAKADDDEEVEYLTETETAKITTPSQNPFPIPEVREEREEKKEEELDPFLASL